MAASDSLSSSSESSVYVAPIAQVGPPRTGHAEFGPNLTNNTEYSLPSQVRVFLRKLTALVLIPTTIGIGLIEWIAWRAGITTPASVTAAAQQHNPKLVWTDSMPYWAALKLARIAQEQPDIVFIGSSRCGQVRSAMFKPYKMYNACMAAWSFDQIKDFVERIVAVAAPKIIVFETDYFAFTDNFAEVWAQRADMEFSYSARGHFDHLLQFAEAFKARPRDAALATLDAGLGRTRKVADNLELLGFNAMYDNMGFRHDGSVMYSPGELAAAPQHTRDVTYGLLSAVHGAPSMAESQIAAMRRLASFGNEHHLALVGMQLPIHKPAVDFLDNNKEYQHDAGIWRQFESDQTRHMFADMGVHFFDLARDPVTADSRNFIDNAHPGETALLGGFLHLLDDNSDFRALFGNLDTEGLRKEYANAQARNEFFDIYGDRF